MEKGDIPQSGTEQSERKIHNYAIVVALLAVFVLLVTLGFYFLNFHAKLSVVNADWGTFGDFVGGTLNPIFSLMSLLALLYTIILQTKEMAETRGELKRAAAAQEKTEQALNGQLEALKIQQFEGTFFALLDQHNKALDRIMAINETSSNKLSNLDVLKNKIIKGVHSTLLNAKSELESYDYLCRNYFSGSLSAAQVH